MEEAEALADKIAIISHGQLLCYGPSIQLKRRFETGYILKLMTADNFKQPETIDLIRQFVPDMSLKSFVRPTLLLILPYKHIERFPELLKCIENKLTELGISSISITNSSLEDVFLKSDSSFTNETKESLDEIDAPYNRINETPLRISGFQQLLAIVYKKGIFMRSQWLYWLMLVRVMGWAFFLPRLQKKKRFFSGKLKNFILNGFCCLFLQFSFPIAAIMISFFSINYKLFNDSDVASEKIDLSIDRITPNDAEVLIWLQNNMFDKDHLQRELHKVIESENIRAKYLSSSRNDIEQGE